MTGGSVWGSVGVTMGFVRGLLVVLTHFSALPFGFDLDFLFELGATGFMAEIIRHVSVERDALF